MILKAYGEKIFCDNVVKDGNNLYCYTNGILVASFVGNKNFGGFAYTDENGNLSEFSAPEFDDNKIDTAIRAVVTALVGSGNISPPSAEGIIGRALEIAHEQMQ